MMTKTHRYHRMLLLVLALIATLVRASIDGGLAITQDRGAAVERVVQSRKDIHTMHALVKQRGKVAENAQLKALGEQAAQLIKALGALERRFRTPPETVGIIYDADQVRSLIRKAWANLHSNLAAPSPAAVAAMHKAERALTGAIAAVNEFMGTQLAEFRTAAATAEIGLLQQVPPL